MSNGTEPSAASKARPAKLQVNTNGAWKDVVRFDAGMDVMTSEVMDAAERLGRADGGRVTFRVAIDDALSATLYRWSREDGWKVANHAD